MSSLLEQAILLHKKGQLKEAENLYKSILKVSSNNFEVTHYLGIIKIQLKQFEEATVWLNKAISINPNNHSVFNNLGVCYRELKKYNEALNNFKIALNIKPDYAEAYNNLAIIYRSLKNYNEAIENYHKAIKLKPDYAEAYNNLGIVYLKIKEFEKSKHNLDQATKIKPDYAEAYYNLGNVHRNLKQYEKSIQYYKIAIKLKKNYDEAYNDLGITYFNQEEFDNAKDVLNEAIKLKPDSAEAYNNLGIVFLSQEELDKAKDTLNEAIKLKPDYAEAYNNLGIVYLSLKNFDQSKNSLNEAIKLKPDYAEAYNNIGMLYFRLKEFEESKINIDRAINLKPDYAKAYVSLGSYYEITEEYEKAEINYKKAIGLGEKNGSNNLGILYLNLGNHKDAEKIYNEIIKSKPKYAEGYFLRSLVYSNSGRSYLALEDLKKSFKLKPEFYTQQDKIYNLLSTQNKICEWDDYKKITNKLIGNLKNDLVKDINPFGLLTFSDSLELIKKVTEEKIKELSLGNIATKFNINKNKKIHIGYYSPDFKEHPVGYILSELLNYHDKDRFEITGFSLSPDPGATCKVKNKIINSMDKFLDCSNKKYLDIIKESKKLKIDIAVDLAGFTAFNKIKAFVKKTAPIQINFLGYPGTLGLQNDYIISDLEVIPKEKQNFYFEKIIYMPNTFLPSFTKFSTSSDLKKENFNLKESNFVFANFNNHGKITPSIFNCWMRILKKVKGSVLWLMDGDEYSRENLKKEAIKRDVESERIIFSTRLDYYEHNVRYKFCNLFLDTFPYNAHSTASSCLFSGVPLLTIKGEAFQSRVASSLLKDLEMDELICLNVEEYENRAITIANSHKELQRIKNKLHNSLTNSKTFNTKNYTQNLEKAYNKIYERYHQKLKPENIFIK